MNVGSQNFIKDGGISFDATRDTMTGQGKHFKQVNGNASKKTSEISQANAHALQEPTSEAQKDVRINDRKEFGCGCVDEKESNDLGHCNGCSAPVVIDQIRMEQSDNEDDESPGSSRVEDAGIPIYIDSEQKPHEMEGTEDRPNEDVIKTQRISQASTITADRDTKGNAGINKMNPTENKVRRSLYKAVASMPASTQRLFQRRRRKLSMFEIRPSTAAEAIEIQNICIEDGAVQTVRESALVLPELTGNVRDTDGRGKSPSNHDRSRRVIADAAASDYGSAPHEKIRSTKSSPGDLSGLLSEGNTRMSPLTKTNTCTAVQSCPSTPLASPRTPLASPRTRRKSLGVLTTAAWGMTTYRDKNAVENTHRSPRRRSLAVSHGVDDLPRNSRKPFWNINQTKNSSDKNQGGIAKLSNESLTIRKKQRDREETKNKLQEKGKANAQEHIFEQENLANPEKNWEECEPQLCSEIHDKELVCERENDTKPDEESEKIRPRLRSRSLEDDRVAARQRALEGRGNPKRKGTRRKSFEMWLSDKEKQTIQKLNSLTLEKHREAEKGAGRRQQRKAGKTYEEWMNDKVSVTAETRRRASLVPCSDTGNEANERQRLAQARYEKWLSEKETQALEKERLMVKEAERKTMEMRKKYEEKKKNLINEGKHSTGSVCG